MIEQVTGADRGAARSASSGRGRGPLAAAILYVSAWLVGLAIPATEGRASGNADVAAAALLQAFPAPLVQAGFVHGVAGIAVYLLAARVLSHLQVRSSAAGKRAHLLGVTAAILSLAQFATLLGAQLSARQNPGLAHRLLGLIDSLDVVKIIVLAGLVVTLTLAVVSATGRSGWMVGAAIAVAVLLLVGASSFLAPTALTESVLAASLLLLLTWSVSIATLTVRRTGRG